MAGWGTKRTQVMSRSRSSGLTSLTSSVRGASLPQDQRDRPGTGPQAGVVLERESDVLKRDKRVRDALEYLGVTKALAAHERQTQHQHQVLQKLLHSPPPVSPLERDRRDTHCPPTRAGQKRGGKQIGFSLPHSSSSGALRSVSSELAPAATETKAKTGSDGKRRRSATPSDSTAKRSSSSGVPQTARGTKGFSRMYPL